MNTGTGSGWMKWMAAGLVITGLCVSDSLGQATRSQRDPTAGNVLGMAFVEVKAGSFQMGSNDGRDNEKPVRTVTITQNFWMGKFEVTQRQYQQLMGSNPSRFKGDDLPVGWVSWNDAVKFCEELTRRERAAGRLPAGLVYRLPTEAEWEYAARGGHLARETVYAGSNDIDEVAWYSGNSQGRTRRVGTKAPNELGLYDMSGNIWEWVHDWYQNSYSGLGTTDPSGPSSGSSRVVRGGSWFIGAAACRVDGRGSIPPTRTAFIFGFRVVVAAPVQYSLATRLLEEVAGDPAMKQAKQRSITEVEKARGIL